MAIASISGSSPSQPVRASMEPVKGIKGISGELKSEKKPAETVIAQENKDNVKNSMDTKRWEELKGVKEVDTKV